jgi:hypothetical protein
MLTVVDPKDTDPGEIPTMHPYPPLPGYPTTTDPDTAQKNVIDTEISNAINEIDAFLAPHSGGEAYLDTVFGVAQRDEAIKNYRAMQQVLASWRDNQDMVKISGWLPRFGRKAHTNATTKIITLPDFAAGAPPASLLWTLIHESAHGVKGEITDAAYTSAAVAFATIPGPDRPLNAPYYDYAIMAWRGGNIATTKTQAGNPNAATGAAVKPGSPQRPQLGTQFQRAQSIVTHARIHAENMLEALTDDCRKGIVDKTRMGLADGLPMPFLPKYWASWINRDVLSKADIDAVNNFVIALTAFHTSVSTTTYTVTIAPAESCAVNLGVMDIRTRGVAEMTTHPIKGDLSADPWIHLMITEMLTAYPPPPSGVTLEALGKVDQQYHVARGQDAHL